MILSSVEHDHLILLCTSEQLLFGTFAHTLHQHFINPAFTAAVALRREFILQSDQFVQTPHLHVLRHVVGQMLGGIRSRPLRILEHKSAVVGTFPHQRQRHLMILFDLGTVTRKNVCGQTAIRHNPANGRHAVQIPFTGVLAVHQFQDTVASALHRQMDMPAHIGFFRNDTQRVVAHILRMGSGETHAHPVGLVCHQPQKFRERNSLSVGPLMEVRIHILPQKRDFLIPALFQIPHLIQDAFHIPAAFPSTRVRHNTIMAKIVAAAHDTDKTGNMRAAHTLRNHILISFRHGQFHVDGLMPQLHLGYQVGQGQISVGACHYIHMVILYQLFLHPFGHTAQHADNQMPTLPSQSMQSLQPVDDFLFGIIPYGTSIQENGIRLIQGFARLVSSHTHHRSHYFAVGHVHLATVSLYKKLFHAVLSNSGCKDSERRAQRQAKT